MTAEVGGKLDAAFERFLSVYTRFGGQNYYGWDHHADAQNFRGPVFWSEQDCAFRLGLELEKEFPFCVHYEFSVASWTFADFDKAIDKIGRIDLAVTDLHDFVENETSQERFQRHQHDIFIEAKYFPAGCTKTWRYDHETKVPAVYADAARLAKHLERGHCKVGACLVVDDDGLFAELYDPATWPASVRLLHASPVKIPGIAVGL